MLFSTLYAVFLITISIITFCLYGIDKKKAVEEKMRISEKCLLSFGIFGGALGALIGMRMFHHKTKHWYFRVINVLMIFVQIVIFFIIVFFETNIK